MPRRDDRPPGGEGLGEYGRKRRAERTPEPAAGAPAAGRDGPQFVVQRHSARSLHYDLRLERDGVLASWAVPKGLPTTPGSRRLAVHTEDHPLAYLDFEGQIPRGEYGAGTMDVYDTGPYEVLEEKRDGGLTVRLQGTRLRGVWTLVPARLDGNERNWLLIRKSDDDAPRAAAGEPRALRRYEPMMAQVVDHPPRGEGWLAEVKWDGFRAVARLADGEPSLWSRRGNDLAERFAVVTNDLGRGLRSPSCVVDGEVVALDERGQSSFSLLQQGEGRLAYYVFDLLELDGEPLLERPLSERRELLRGLVDPTSRTVRYSEAFPDPAALLAAAREHGLEGIVCKRAASRYYPGRRSREWLKLKLRSEQEFLIAGFTRGEGARTRFGSLVLAYRKGDALTYAGNCGSGFTDGEIDRLLGLLEPLQRDTAPFDGVPRDPRLRGARIYWVEPQLVCEVEFTEWTHDGRVRAPVYKGLREDSSPGEVVREEPVEEAGDPEDLPMRNLDKVFFPRDGITKGDLIDYYRAIAPVVVPHLAGRPFTMKRYPDGIDAQPFFQKDAPSHMPGWIRRADLSQGRGGRDPAKGPVSYAVVDDEPALLWMIAMGCIDLHVWYSRLPHVEEPDFVLFDLDPSPDVGYDEVVRVAQLLHQLLGAIGLQAFPKTSGSDGMHVCVPVARGHSYDDTRLFAQAVAGAIERTHPELVTTVWAKQRRRGVFVDYKQNGLGATIAAVYSVRPHDGAPVSCPLRWEEVEEGLDPRDFPMQTVLDRVARHGDLFAPVLDGDELGQDVKRLLAGGLGKG